VNTDIHLKLITARTFLYDVFNRHYFHIAHTSLPTTCTSMQVPPLPSRMGNPSPVTRRSQSQSTGQEHARAGTPTRTRKSWDHHHYHHHHKLTHAHTPRHVCVLFVSLDFGVGVKDNHAVVLSQVILMILRRIPRARAMLPNVSPIRIWRSACILFHVMTPLQMLTFTEVFQRVSDCRDPKDS
jgi:hypothetical protein